MAFGKVRALVELIEAARMRAPMTEDASAMTTPSRRPERL
jgi:hypothetical protein